MKRDLAILAEMGRAATMEYREDFEAIEKEVCFGFDMNPVGRRLTRPESKALLEILDEVEEWRENAVREG